MTFTNPRKVTVLTEHLDFYQWPCISGESFPPTFTPGSSGTVGYDTATTYPTVRVSENSTSGVSSSRANWPALPLTSPRTGTFNGYTLTCKFYIAVLQVNNAKVGLQLDGNGFNKVEFNTTFGGANGTTTYIDNVGTAGAGNCPSLNTWHDLSMTMAANGKSIIFSIDGAVIRTATSGSTIANFPPAFTAVATNGGSFSADFHVTQVKHSWS